jgi:hypothetical protein
VSRIKLNLLLLASTIAWGQMWNSGQPQAVPDLDTAGAGAPTSACSVGVRYFQTDATPGYNRWFCTAINTWTKEASSAAGYISATFKSPPSLFGRYHAFGFYEAPAAASARNQGALTQTLGSANNAYESHVFVVASGAGTASGGTNGVPRLTITGTSFSATTGTRTASDSEVIVSDCTTATTNKYYESAKTWLGQVVLTLSQTGDRTTYAFTFNYGLASVTHFAERSVTLNQVEMTGRAGNADTGFNVQFLLHTPAGAGWAYSAAAFVPGGTVLWNMDADFVTEKNLVNGVRFHYHRKGLTQIINGAADEGFVARITTGSENSVESSDLRVFYTVN